MQVKGKITKMLEKVTGEKKDGSGQWVKQSFILETEETYNNLYCFEVFGDDKVEQLNKFNKVGDLVDVDFNVSTNEWQGKYYTSLQAWKVFKSDFVSPKEQIDTAFVPVEDDNDGLPF